MKVTCALATIVAILTTGPAAAQSAAEAVKGFSIVLVEGSLRPGTSSDLSAPARAALEDIKDFLPFKGFRLLDASWMLGAADVRSRLRGGDTDYDVAVAVTPQADAKSLAIKFVLRDASSAQDVSAAEVSLNTARQMHERANLQAVLQAEYKALETLRQRLNERHPEVLRAEESVARARERLGSLEQAQIKSLRLGTSDQPRRVPRADAVLIDTSFSMRVGETVVVGTSRVNGERALIALMTAVSK